MQTAGSQVPITGLAYSIGHPPPTVSATVTAAGAKRIVHSRSKIADNNAVTFAEQTNGLLHVIGRVRGTSGTVPFRPAFGPAGRRQLIARITQNGLPYRNVTLGSFSVPPPALPGRARRLRVYSTGSVTGSATATLTATNKPKAGDATVTGGVLKLTKGTGTHKGHASRARSQARETSRATQHVHEQGTYT